MSLDFLQPAALLLLPLAGLPLLRRRSDTLTFSYLAWLPVDRVGRVLSQLWRLTAVLTMASIVVGLAGPGQSVTQIQRTGRGAEVLILMDRSSSMDNIPRESIAPGVHAASASKNMIVREMLTRFVSRRQDDRIALMTFSTKPMLNVPFTERSEVCPTPRWATHCLPPWANSKGGLTRAVVSCCSSPTAAHSSTSRRADA
jgi:mxaC protein